MPPSSPLPRAQPTALLDREGELAAIHGRLTVDGARLLTLAGPAGVGKTCLALEAAARLTGAFPDGVALVDLAPLRHPHPVLPAIAQALGLADTGDCSSYPKA